MTMTTIRQWLRAMNPVEVPRGMAEAQRSARALVIGLVISLIGGIPTTVWLFTAGRLESAMTEQYSAMGLSAGEIATQQALMETMWPFALGMGLVLSVVFYGAIGLAQWKYMGRTIPLVLLSFFVLGAVMEIGQRLMGIAPNVNFPAWVLAAAWGPALVAAVINAAALQGAIMLHNLKGQR